jgi:hypothetical protein
MLRALPFQRPASPEIKLSPSETIAVGPEVGLPSDFSGRLTIVKSAAINASIRVKGSLSGTLRITCLLDIEAGPLSGKCR